MEHATIVSQPKRAATVNCGEAAAIIKARIEQEPDGTQYWSVISFMPYASCRTARAHEPEGLRRYTSMVVEALDPNTEEAAESLRTKVEAAIRDLTNNFEL